MRGTWLAKLRGCNLKGMSGGEQREVKRWGWSWASMSVCTFMSPKERRTAEMQSCLDSIAKGQVQRMLLLVSSLLPAGTVLEEEHTQGGAAGKLILYQNSGQWKGIPFPFCLPLLYRMPDWSGMFFLSHLVGTWGFCGKHFIWAQIHRQVPD